VLSPPPGVPVEPPESAPPFAGAAPAVPTVPLVPAVVVGLLPDAPPPAWPGLLVELEQASADRAKPSGRETRQDRWKAAAQAEERIAIPCLFPDAASPVVCRDRPCAFHFGEKFPQNSRRKFARTGGGLASYS
jgi:hypothetical protein